MNNTVRMKAKQRGVRFKRTLSRAELAKQVKAALGKPRTLRDLQLAGMYGETVIRVKAGEGIRKGTKARMIDSRYRYDWRTFREYTEIRVSYREKGRTKLKWVRRDVVAWGIAA